MDNETFRAARLAMGLNQSEMAEKLGLQQSSISRFETGVLKIDRRTELSVNSLLASFKPAPLERARAA